MMRVFLVADRENWSYMQIAQALVKYNTDPDLHLDVMALKGREAEFRSRQAGYDRCLIMGHQMLGGIIPFFHRIRPHWLTGIHSSHAFDPDLKTSPEYDCPPPQWLLKLLGKFQAVNAVSRRLTNLFSNEGLNVAYTPNGVDTERFQPTSEISTDGPLRIGVAYTPKHDRRKGVTGFIRPACEKAGAKLFEARARSDQHVPPSAMAEWHNLVDCYVCASSSEGFSIAVLEAAACGRVIISTRVGGSTELIQDGVNGFLVDRTVDAIADRLTWIRDHRESAALMGKRMRQNVVGNWSWEKRAPAWLSFLRA